ncbi:MAG TPA: hypothetical protein VEJ84_04775 [Acidimicrobiales bacterium]|nr:hypothetical protein [Acidimicrobiales bacterium]
MRALRLWAQPSDSEGGERLPVGSDGGVSLWPSHRHVTDLGARRVIICTTYIKAVDTQQEAYARERPGSVLGATWLLLRRQTSRAVKRCWDTATAVDVGTRPIVSWHRAPVS